MVLDFFLPTTTHCLLSAGLFLEKKKKSLLTLYTYDFLCFLLNINSLVQVKMEVSATLTCFCPAEMKGHHGSHPSSDNESMKSFRKIMHYMVPESSVSLHRDTDDASSKKT